MVKNLPGIHEDLDSKGETLSPKKNFAIRHMQFSSPRKHGHSLDLSGTVQFLQGPEYDPQDPTLNKNTVHYVLHMTSIRPLGNTEQQSRGTRGSS